MEVKITVKITELNGELTIAMFGRLMSNHKYLGRSGR
jgi:hypothetical protein